MANIATNFASSPAVSPLPSFRKLGKHKHELVKSSTSAAPSQGLSSDEEKEKKGNEVGSTDEQHYGIVEEEGIEIEKKHHHSVDKSICGGGVILGGLATIFLVAIVCYIRVTRRRHSTPIA
ncbi:hypothetical protein KY290_005604 [Solanum tuberosum]|uniref:Uncharacterized protein n=1 Tax=Solanum tuberosum TaxID=4113 RepID=A0ABQ7WH29_SOLTU|nr:hypothetical protein KY290_005604 [Solanum tuberosum]